MGTEATSKKPISTTTIIIIVVVVLLLLCGGCSVAGFALYKAAGTSSSSPEPTSKSKSNFDFSSIPTDENGVREMPNSGNDSLPQALLNGKYTVNPDLSTREAPVQISLPEELIGSFVPARGADNNSLMVITDDQKMTYYASKDDLKDNYYGGKVLVHEITLNDMAGGDTPGNREIIENTAKRGRWYYVGLYADKFIMDGEDQFLITPDRRGKIFGEYTFMIDDDGVISMQNINSKKHFSLERVKK